MLSSCSPFRLHYNSLPTQARSAKVDASRIAPAWASRTVAPLPFSVFARCLSVPDAAWSESWNDQPVFVPSRFAYVRLLQSRTCGEAHGDPRQDGNCSAMIVLCRSASVFTDSGSVRSCKLVKTYSHFDSALRLRSAAAISSGMGRSRRRSFRFRPRRSSIVPQNPLATASLPRCTQSHCRAINSPRHGSGNLRSLLRLCLCLHKCRQYVLCRAAGKGMVEEVDRV